MNRYLSTPLRREFFFLILLPFLVWVGCFWRFIFGPLPAVGGASYAEKTIFFIDNLFRGGYPLWDPGYYNGFAFDFFLRRIGDGNPFYVLIILAKACGAADANAYNFFLMGYYFLAMVGFWLICRHFLRHRLAYIGAYVMLLFSGWGTRVFSDYILLIFVPLVWFVYFLIVFLKEGKRYQFLGLILAASIAMTTYIPFFFLTAVSVFVLCFAVFFTPRLPGLFRNVVDFFRRNVAFAVVCLMFFAVAITPEFQFFQESSKGEFVMPGRNDGSEQKSVLAVNMSQAKVGDLMSQGYFYRVLEDHKDLVALDFFVPYFFFLAFLVSMINPLTRVTVFLAVNILLLGMLCVSDTSRIYAFLYKNIFMFKYMRMMSFFFWTAVFPLSVFLVMRQVDIFLDSYRKKRHVLLYVFVIVMHVLFGFWALTRAGIAWTSWIAVLASLVFFLGVLSGKFGPRVLLGVLCLGLMVQPMEMVGYVARNDALFRQDTTSSRHDLSLKFNFNRGEVPAETADDPGSVRPEGEIYCGTSWSQDLAVNVPLNVKRAFTAHTLYLMDNTQIHDASSREFFFLLAQKWRGQMNLALLSPDKASPGDVRSLHPAVPPERVGADSKTVKVLRFDAVTLRLKTSLDRPRFLLWTDNYHSDWHAFINGTEVPLLRADHAFKGVWLPAGEADVLFRFGTPWMHLWRYFVWFAFLMVLGAVIVLALSESRSCLQEQGRSA